MTYATPLLRVRSARLYCHALTLALVALSLAGCGGSGSHVTPLSGSTKVVVVASSSANAQLTRFNATLNNVTLSTQAGAMANLLSSPLYPEFIHLNGLAEPLATLTVPQGVYTTATASFGYASFTCETLDSDGGIGTSIYAYGTVPASNVTVTLPEPITITGDTMVLSLNLDAAKSASYTQCMPNGLQPYAITPTLTITPASLSSQPSNPANGLFRGLAGIVVSVDSSDDSFTVASADGSNYGDGSPSQVADPASGAAWQVKANSATGFQGISDMTKLIAGMPVDMDAAIQADGSLLAKRIAVYDTNPTNLSLWTGPLIYKSSVVPDLYAFGQDQIGPILGSGANIFDFSSATFSISGELTDVANLPFHPSFTSGNMVAGQNVAMSMHAAQYPEGSNYIPLTTVTLLPQTINGTVSAVSSESGYTVYTVTLAPYDLFPTFAVQGGQATVLADPATVTVYTGSNTQSLANDPLTSGSLLRFHGLIFNDSGSLKMDCFEIEDGVSQSLSLTPANAQGKALLSTSPETRSYMYSIPKSPR